MLGANLFLINVRRPLWPISLGSGLAKAVKPGKRLFCSKSRDSVWKVSCKFIMSMWECFLKNLLRSLILDMELRP